jgi:hypothetical protein
MARIFGNTAPKSPSLAFSIALSSLFALLLIEPCSCFAGARHAAADSLPEAKLIAKIPVAPLGYQPPGALYLLTQFTFSSLNFIDDQHLLFTFHRFELLRRELDALESDDDQVIRAEVLSLPDGHVDTTADWRMHDRSRYLWPLSEGRFLVRQRDTYWVTDASLKPRDYMRSPTQVLHTEVSPDGRLMLIEDVAERHTPEEHKKLAVEDGEPPPEDAILAMMDVDSKVMEAELRSHDPVALPVTSSGYVTVDEKKEDDYVVRFIPFHGQPVVMGMVASTCTPRETFLSAKALMIASCGPNTADMFLDTWTIDGKKLWRGRRDGETVWPTFAVALDGSRFAIGLLQVDRPVTTPDSLDDDDVKSQMVQVFDTKSGALLLATSASPVLTAGQNFCLSPDGDRFAVLRNGAIEVYQVPTAPATAQKK